MTKLIIYASCLSPTGAIRQVIHTVDLTTRKDSHFSEVHVIAVIEIQETGGFWITTDYGVSFIPWHRITEIKAE